MKLKKDIESLDEVVGILMEKVVELGLERSQAESKWVVESIQKDISVSKGENRQA